MDAFQPLGLKPPDPEGRGNRIGNIARTQRDRDEAQQHPGGIDRDIGHLAAKFDQGHPQLALFTREAGIARRNRRADHRLDIKVRVLDRLGNVADRRAIGQHDVNIDPQPLRMEPLGIGHAVGPVERVMCGLGVEHHPPIGLDHLARRNQQMFNIIGLDPPPAYINFDLRDPAGQPRTRGADPDAADRGVGHLLGPLNRIAHRIGRRRHIGDIAALDPLRGAVARAEHDDLARVSQPGDHRRNAERADVDRAIDARNAGRGHQSLSFLAGLAALVVGVGASAGFD